MSIMSIFKKNLQTLSVEAEQLTETNEQLVKDLAEAKALALPNTEELATLTNANAILETKLDETAKEVATLTESQAEFDTKVTSAVAKQVADNGLEVGKIDGNNDKPELNKLEQMNLLEGAEAQDFFKANKPAILALHALKN